MTIAGVGEFEPNGDGGWYLTEARALPVFGGKECDITLEDYDPNDPNDADFPVALRNFLALDFSALKAVEQDVYHYYKDMNDGVWEPEDEEYLVIESPADVWAHVQFGDEITVSRQNSGDKSIYFSLECECDWEPEHGLQIVFKNGLAVNKISPYDGHLTNSHAFGDDSLEDVIYQPIG